MAGVLREINRRSFLSAAASIGSVAVLSTIFIPESAYAAEVVTESAPPNSLSTFYGSNVYLKNTPQGPGAIRTFDNAFSSTVVTKMSYFTDKDNRLKAALSVIGLNNQFQIIDVASGVNEKTLTPFTTSAAGISGLDFNTVDSSVYFTGTGGLYKYTRGASAAQDLGKVSAAASSSYGVAFDSKGRVWAGSYPDAAVCCYDPATGKTSYYPTVDAESDYVRNLAILNDVVYVGTGAISPKVISFHVNTPLTRTVISVPDISPSGFVNALDVHDGKVFVTYETPSLVSKTSVYNPATKTWTTLKYAPSSHQMVSLSGDEWVYFVAKISGVPYVIKWSTRTGYYQTVCASPLSPKGLHLRNSTSGLILHMFGEVDGVYRMQAISLPTGQSALNLAAPVKESSYKVQDLIAGTDNKLYVGGYMGDGIASIDLTTGKRWSAPEGNPIHQIEGMIEYDSNKIYVGSYGSADLISFTKNPLDIKRIIRLRTDYLQSRPFAWAVAAGMVVNGTVPEYGYRGGALTVINPVDDSVVRVLNKFIPEQSIVGMTGDGDIVYGTTSVRGGYGIPDDTSPAKVFAYNVRTNTKLWVNESLTSETEIQSPVVVNGRLFVAVANGVIELDMATGQAVRSFVLFSRDNVAGYRNVRMGYVAESDSLIHSGGGTITAISLKGNYRTLLYQGTGGTMTVSKDGRIFAVTNGSLDVSEINIAYSPSITSSADVISVSPGGGINRRKSNGAGQFATGEGIVSSGYSDANSVHAVDWNGDGIIDLVSNHADGTLRVRYGLPQGGFEEFKIIGTSGWNLRRITVGAWDKDATYPGLLSIDPSGNLEHWKVSSTGNVSLVKRIGTEWQDYDIALLDLKYNGVPGIVAREGAAMFWYPRSSTGYVYRSATTRVELASGGWSQCQEFASLQGHWRSYNGIVWKDSSGLLRYTSNLTSTALGGNMTYDTNLASYRLGGTSK